MAYRYPTQLNKHDVAGAQIPLLPKDKQCFIGEVSVAVDNGLSAIERGRKKLDLGLTLSYRQRQRLSHNKAKPGET